MVMTTAWFAAAMTTTTLLLLSGCTSSPDSDAQPPAPESTSTPTATTTGRSGRIEAEFLARPELPSCGTLDIPNGERRPSMAEQLLDCLTDADPEVGAELLVVGYTVEGDPIRIYYRREPDRYSYVVYEDGTADTFGMQRWSTYECDGLTLTGDSINCLVE